MAVVRQYKCITTQDTERNRIATLAPLDELDGDEEWGSVGTQRIVLGAEERNQIKLGEHYTLRLSRLRVEDGSDGDGE